MARLQNRTIRGVLLSWLHWLFGDHDPIGIAVCDVTWDELHAADAHGNIAIALTRLGGLARVSSQRLATEVHLGDDSGIANSAIDNHTSPTMILAQASDDVSHQRGVHGCIAIDNQHASWVVLAQNALEQRIVLETLHRGDRTGELRGATRSENCVSQLRTSSPMMSTRSAVGIKVTLFFGAFIAF